MACSDPTMTNTITVSTLTISSSLDLLIVDAQTCGTFTESYIYIDDGILTNTGIDLSSLLSSQIISGDTSSIHLELTPQDIGLGTGKLDRFITVRFVNRRTFDTHPDITETYVTAVVSYASIYPCLVHKVTQATADCSECAALNNAMLIHMLMQTIQGYLAFGRVSDAAYSYMRIKEICREYDLVYSTDPTVCQQYGGIGCWIINSTFQVADSGYIPANDPALG